MKSLKKTLSLVLVLVMVLGMFGAASAFTDDATIQYKTAVEVMTGIGAIKGFPDGSFGPTKTITRAEAAKMVAYAILGPDVADSLTGVTSTFSDVPANPYGWAIPSIEYLVKEGVVSGVGGGKFNPAGEISALEVAKMLLCAAGYGANDEYVGEGWALAVAIDANKQNIFAGRAANANDLDKPASREEVALYCYNALTKINQVEYSPLLGTYVGKGTGMGPTTAGPTIGTEIYGYTTLTTPAMITGTGTNAKGQTTVALDGATTLGLVFTPTSAQMGHIFQMHYGNNGAVYYAEQLSTAYTVPNTVNTAQKLYNALGRVVTWVSDNSVPAFENNAQVTAIDPDGATTAVSDAAVVALAGKTIVVYNGVIRAVITAPAVTLNLVTKVTTTLGSESITLSTIGVLPNQTGNDRVVEYAGIAAGDFVIATATGTGGTAIYSLVKVNPVTGVFTGKTTAGTTTTYTVGGSSYTASSVPNNTGTLIAPTAMVIGAQYALYLDASGKIIAVAGDEATVGNYAYIAQFGKKTVTNEMGGTVDTLVADIYFTDGSHAVYPLDVKTAGTAFTGAVFASGTATGTTVRSIGLYDVTVNASGTAVAKLLTPANAAVPGGAAAGNNSVQLSEISIVKGLSRIGVDGTDSLYADANSMVFHVTGVYGTTSGADTFTVKVVKGIANFETGATLTEGYLKANAAGVKYLTAAVASTAVSSGVDPEVVFFGGASTQTVDANGTTRTYVIYKNGVQSTVSYDEAAAGFAAVVTTPGFYTTGAANLASYTTAAHVSAELTVSSFVGGTMYFTTGSDVAIVADSVPVVDVTQAQSFVSFTNGDTVKVFVAWTTNPNATTVKTATAIYVTSVS